MKKTLLVTLILFSAAACDGKSLQQSQNSVSQTQKMPTAKTGHSITEQQTSVSIDLDNCFSDTAKVYVAFGSTTINIVGMISDNKCELNYSTEIENPNGTAVPIIKCFVPNLLHTLMLRKTNEGVDFGPIARYCEK